MGKNPHSIRGQSKQPLSSRADQPPGVASRRAFKRTVARDAPLVSPSPNARERSRHLAALRGGGIAGYLPTLNRLHALATSYAGEVVLPNGRAVQLHSYND